MKKRKLISILVSAGVVSSLMFAMTGPVHAWGWAEGHLVTSSTGAPSTWWGDGDYDDDWEDWKYVVKYRNDDDHGRQSDSNEPGDSPEATVNVKGKAYSGGSIESHGLAWAEHHWDYAAVDTEAIATTNSTAIVTGQARTEGSLKSPYDYPYSWWIFGYQGSEATARGYAEAEFDSNATAEVIAKAIDGGDANSEAAANAFDNGNATAKSTSLADMDPFHPWMWDLYADATSEANASHGGTADATSTADSIGVAHGAEATSTATADGEGSEADATANAWAEGGFVENPQSPFTDGYRSDAVANADATATLDSSAEAIANGTGKGGGDVIADANAEADKYSDAHAQAEADTNAPGSEEVELGIENVTAEAYANAISDHYSNAWADAGANSVDSNLDTYAGDTLAISEAHANVGSEAKSEAYADATDEDSASRAEAWSTADKYSDAYAQADADSSDGGYADALAVAIADEESMATDATLVLVPRIVTVPLLDQSGEQVYDGEGQPVMQDIVVYDYVLVEEDVYAAKAMADVEAIMTEGSATGGAFAQAQFGSTANAELTVTNWLGGDYASGWSEAQADFDSTATSIVNVLNEGGYMSDGQANADAQFNSDATAVTKVSNYYGSYAWGSTEAKANFDSSAVSYVVVDEGFSGNFSAGGSATSDADYGSTAVAAGKSSTLQSEASGDYAGHEAYGSASADAIFESTALAFYEAESVNGAGAKAYADSTAICSSTALTQVVAHADGFGYDGPNAARADGTALAVEDADATAIAFAEAANDLPGMQQPGGLLAVANANSIAAAGGTAFSLSMSDATSLDLVPEGFETDTGNPVSATDFDTGGAAWAWGIATEDQVFSGTVTVAVLGATSTAVSLADTGMELGVPGEEPGAPGVYVYAEVEPAP